MSIAVPNPREWVEKYADFLYSYALARLDDEDLARDLVQETFLAGLEQLDNFRGQSTERTWLAAILKYKVIGVYRKKSSRVVVVSGIAEPEKEFFEADTGHWKEEYAAREFGLSSPDPTLRKELELILQKCLKKLPALWFSIFSLKYLDELATEAICEQMKVTAANYWVIIHRAKLNLRACLQKEEGL